MSLMQIESNKSKSMISSQNSQKQQNALKFTQDLILKLNKYLQENKKKAKQTAQVQMKKKSEDKQQSNTRQSQELFQQLNLLYQRITKIKNRIQKAQKLKQQRIFFYMGKLNQFLNVIKQLMDKTQQNNFKSDKNLTQLIAVTSKTILQTDRILTGFEKQSSIFCCGRTTELKHSLDHVLTELIGYSFLWRQIQKLSPFIVENIKQIYVPFEFNQIQLKQFIKDQVLQLWPQPQTVIRQIYKERQPEAILCERAHVDSQVSVSSLSQKKPKQILQEKVANNGNNYMKVQEILKLKDDLQAQIKMREAHQKLFGFCRPQQIQEAISDYQKVIQNQSYNSSSAFNALGIIFQQGKYVPADRQRSLNYFSKSAQLNNPEGIYKIGKYYEKGLLKLKSNSKNGSNTQSIQDSYLDRNSQMKSAIEHYEKSAQFNHLDAITDLGFIYQKGILNDTRVSQSKVSVTDNQKSGYSQEDVNNSNNYFLQPNFEYAIKYYSKAKKQNFPRAINNLGALYLKQADYIRQKVKGANVQKGIKYLKKAASLNYIKAYYNLGKCYQNGIGVPQNLQKARSYYQKGSEKGDMKCKLQYVKSLLKDKNVMEFSQKDQTLLFLIESLRSILIHEPQNGQALYYMGLFNEKGIGMDVNKQMAFFYIEKSEKLNFIPAITKLGDYYYSGYYVKKDLEKATKLYEKAAHKNQPQAKLNIALMIQKGLIKPSNGKSDEAIKKLFKQALAQQDPNAYLLTGLKNQNYQIPQHFQKLNSKIKKSIELGNKDTIRLLEKANMKNLRQRQTKETLYSNNQNYMRNSSNRILKQGFSPNLKHNTQNDLIKVRSLENMKIPHTSRH